VLALSLLVVLAAAPVPVVSAPHPTHALQVEVGRDLAITGASAGLWLTLELLKPQLAPKECRWCDRAPGGGAGLNPFDRLGYEQLKWENTQTAGQLSDLGAYVVLPLGMAGGGALLAHTAGAARDIPENLLIVAQTTALAGLMNQTVKFLVGRQRPYALRGTDAQAVTNHRSDSNLSFYSGHTNLAFVLATSMGTVAELRGYQHRWLIWAVGLPLAASVGWMRVAADRHHLTDVVVGAVMGAAFGVAVPLLLHPRLPDEPTDDAQPLRMSAVPGMFSISGTF